MNFKNLLITTVLFILTSCFTQAQDYNNWFTADVLRIDFSHVGDAESEYYFTEQFIKEKVWAGAKTKLIDQMGYGDNFFEVYDSTICFTNGKKLPKLNKIIEASKKFCASLFQNKLFK